MIFLNLFGTKFMYICKKLQIKYVCMYVCMCSIGFPVSHFLHVWVPCGYPGLACLMASE